ncbi:MAG: redoxin domain-containing protein [Flavobacteriales bacterium]
MINKIFTLLLVASTFSVFAQNDVVKIQGTITNAVGKTLYLEYFVNNITFKADSVKLNKKGKFSLPAKVPEPDFYRIGFGTEKDFILLVLKSGDKPAITADGKDINGTYKVTGSPDSELVRVYLDKIVSLSEFQENLQKSKSLPAENQLKMDSASKDFIQFRNDFITNNSKSLAVFVAMGQLNRDTDVELYRTIEKGIGESMPESKYHAAVKAQLTEVESYITEKQEAERIMKEREKLTAIGSPAPELNLPDAKGKVLKMEEFRGKYVLIDFWASWCGPCRKENPNMVKLYEKYNKSGFEILGVSLDNNKERWLQAIEQDKLTWPWHVSDLKQWNTAARTIYDFNGIPYTVLIDNQGNILEKGLRGPALEQKLHDIFGF